MPQTWVPATLGLLSSRLGGGLGHRLQQHQAGGDNKSGRCMALSSWRVDRQAQQVLVLAVVQALPVQTHAAKNTHKQFLKALGLSPLPQRAVAGRRGCIACRPDR